MAELLEKRLLRLKGRLADLKKLYESNDRPLAVDMEIQLLEEQLETLDDTGYGEQIFH